MGGLGLAVYHHREHSITHRANMERVYISKYGDA